MKLFKHIFVCLIAAMLLMPSALSFSHIFSGHGHELCDNYADEHFHATSIDCELHSFNNNPALIASFINFETFDEKHVKKQFFDFYQFLSDYQRLPFELRGPPMPA
ncbi:hypothetical protein [Salegentibacter maritimus]|uniref:Uncharacterized protein n=1 Tax=Salegentibacter maritimus TaxID=2794347 RepID=A0ABS0TD27_9FLAO|nr:hypothetical protein [Salegentibacter maritimus]MBI6115250.1 hypothetical protein [Salegentibacter maritimus]MBI6118935.1 hypothetical protein [Salegentibacter maritimus]